MQSISQSNILVENAMKNIQRISNNIQMVNRLFAKSRSLSNFQKPQNTYIIQNNSILTPKSKSSYLNLPFSNNLNSKNKLKGCEKIYNKNSKNLLHSVANFKKVKCDMHLHEKCQACKIKQQQPPLKKKFLGKVKKLRNNQRRNKSIVGIYLVQKVNLSTQKKKEKIVQFLDFKKTLQQKLKKINLQIQNQKEKLLLKKQKCCLSSLKTSIKNQFPQMKQNQIATSLNINKLNAFSFHNNFQITPNSRYNKIQF